MLQSDLYLWLSYSRVPTAKINRLLDNYTPAELWNSFCDGSRYSSDDKTLNALKRTASSEYIERAKQYLQLNHIEYITRADPLYPVALSQSEVDPPPVLYYKGRIETLREPCIAVVGTRRASQYGRYVTDKIVEELASCFTVVSGLATGIDGYAHEAALRAGGLTAAVLGSGLFHASPVSNLALMDKICESGVVLSEYTPDVHASEYTFPQRNRIISGLCKGVLVIEAAEKSGSLITANCALDQGRDVFAVPGDIDKRRSAGTNELIKRGAVAVTCAKDILDYYSMEAKADEKRTATLDFDQQRIMDMLGGGEKSFDELVAGSGMSVSQLNSALSVLMIYGLIHQKAKNIYAAD